MDTKYGRESNRVRNYPSSERSSGSGLFVFVAVVLFIGIAVLSYFIFFKKYSDDSVDNSDDNQESVVDDSDSRSNTSDSDSNSNDSDEDNDETDLNDDSNSRVDSSDGEISLADLTSSDKEIGSTVEDAEFELTEIKETQYSNYYMFSFVLSSDDDSEIPLITAKYLSGAGYVRVVLDQVTSDQSGIGYQASRRIDEDGISQLYHDVSANQTEEVYNIGVSCEVDTYLTNDDQTIVLYVSYPGEVDLGDYEDLESFTQNDFELEDVNEDSNVKVTGYSWGMENGGLKFTWDVSSSSDNPIPAVSAGFENNDLIVVFDGIQNDVILDNDPSFFFNLSRVADSVSGVRSGDTSTYSFEFDDADEVEYKLYRNLSPNQVILELRFAD